MEWGMEFHLCSREWDLHDFSIKLRPRTSGENRTFYFSICRGEVRGFNFHFSRSMSRFQNCPRRGLGSRPRQNLGPRPRKTSVRGLASPRSNLNSAHLQLCPGDYWILYTPVFNLQLWSSLPNHAWIEYTKHPSFTREGLKNYTPISIWIFRFLMEIGDGAKNCTIGGKTRENMVASWKFFKWE